MEPKILIIDDDPDSWQLLSTILRAHHFHPFRAADSIQAVSEARRHQPQAILLDLGLPGGDGFLVLERLKANRLLAAIPVIVVTAQDLQQAEGRARELGAAAFFQKPVKAEALIATIQVALSAQG